MLKRLIITSVLLAGMLFSTNAWAAEVWSAEGFKAPESALYDPDRDVFYVSNINGGPDEKNGAGYISKLSRDGVVQDATVLLQTHPGDGQGGAEAQIGKGKDHGGSEGHDHEQQHPCYRRQSKQQPGPVFPVEG